MGVGALIVVVALTDAPRVVACPEAELDPAAAATMSSALARESPAVPEGLAVEIRLACDGQGAVVVVEGIELRLERKLALSTVRADLRPRVIALLAAELVDDAVRQLARPVLNPHRAPPRERDWAIRTAVGLRLTMGQPLSAMAVVEGLVSWRWLFAGLRVGGSALFHEPAHVVPLAGSAILGARVGFTKDRLSAHLELMVEGGATLALTRSDEPAYRTSSPVGPLVGGALRLGGGYLLGSSVMLTVGIELGGAWGAQLRVFREPVFTFAGATTSVWMGLAFPR